MGSYVKGAASLLAPLPAGPCIRPAARGVLDGAHLLVYRGVEQHLVFIHQAVLAVAQPGFRGKLDVHGDTIGLTAYQLSQVPFWP